jgi:hypothetical protein
MYEAPTIFELGPVGDLTQENVSGADFDADFQEGDQGPGTFS